MTKAEAIAAQRIYAHEVTERDIDRVLDVAQVSTSRRRSSARAHLGPPDTDNSTFARIPATGSPTGWDPCVRERGPGA